MVQETMQGEVGSIWCLVLVLAGPLLGSCSAVSPSVVIDGYTHNSTLTSGDSVSLGTQLILVCRVVGLPFGMPFSYNWVCPSKICEVPYGQKIYNEHIMAVNTTATRDRATYTCHVTMHTGGQRVNGSFTLNIAGGHVVHSYGRLIPHEFPITDLQQISGPDENRTITCTLSKGKAAFFANGQQLETGGVSQQKHGSTATLVVDPTDSFQNKGAYCTRMNQTNLIKSFFYLFMFETRPSTPRLLVRSAAQSEVTYQVNRSNTETNPLVAGYEVLRFGVPMIGEYVNAGTESSRTVTISPAVPGAQYRITAWALCNECDNRSRSETPAVEYATTREARPSPPRFATNTRVFEDGMELNWLPPIESNGEVHYVIYYTTENDTEQSIDTGNKLTHYNLTGLERNRVYTNISVQAVNSAGMSDRSAAIPQYNHTPPVGHSSHQAGDAATIAGALTSFLVAVLLLTLTGGVVAVVIVRARRKKRSEAKGPADNDNKYQNSRHIEEAYCYMASADKRTINSASATASFSTFMNEDKQCECTAAESNYKEPRGIVHSTKQSEKGECQERESRWWN